MSDETVEKLEAYQKVFGEEVPLFQLFHGDEAKLVEMIDKCLEAKKNVREMGYLADRGVIY